MFGQGGGGGILRYQSPGPKPYPSGIIHQETTTVTSNTALAETMTNLISMFIVAWHGNARSVLNAEQPIVSPIVHKPSTEAGLYPKGYSCNNTPGTSDTSLGSGP